jgi:chorismate mutase
MPDLKTLGKDFISVDRLIMDLIKRRMDLAQLVGREKLREEIKKTAVGSTERENEKAEDGNKYIEIYNRDRELERLEGIKEHADRIGLDSDFARAVLYLLFGESIKEQVKFFAEDASA